MDIQIRLTTKPQIQLWRVPHDVERYDFDGDDLGYAGARIGRVRKEIRDAGVARPEIYRVWPDHTTRIGEKHQWLWKDINPELSNIRWRSLLDNYLAWTNQSGFPGRHDYVNNMDVDENLPNFHAALVNGGMILEGQENGDKVWLYSLLISDPCPTASELLKTHMWSYGTSVIPRDGSISYITRKGIDGNYKKVRVPFLTTRPVWLPKRELHKLPAGFEPPPNWIVGDPIQ